jgi:hypothetical protein
VIREEPQQRAQSAAGLGQRGKGGGGTVIGSDGSVDGGPLLDGFGYV